MFSNKSVLIACLVSLFASGSCAFAETRTLRMVTVEASGAKMWIPSTLVVKKGDTVRIEAVSKLTGPAGVHGLQIEAFKVKEVVDEKGKTVEFIADKPGIFPIGCHLHPAHIGGQLVVLD